MAGGEEVLLELGEGDGGGDLVGGFEAGAAVEGGVVVGGGAPVVGGGGEGPSDADGVAVGVDPAGEAGPFAQQGFVGDFDGGFAGDGVVVGDDEPVGPVRVDDHGVDAGELLEGGTAAEVVGVVAGGDQLGEQAADVVAPVGRGGVVEVFGAAGERAGDAAEVLVGGGGDGGVQALFEQLGEGELQEGQRPGAGDDVADHGGDQAGLEADPDALGGHDDGVLELGGGHGGDREGVGAHHRAQRGVLEGQVELVGAQGRHHPQGVLGPGGVGVGGVGEQLGEPVPDHGVGGQGPQLFELVDDHDELFAGGGEVAGDRGEPAGGAQPGGDGGFVVDGGDAPQGGFELDERVGPGDHRHHQGAAAAELGDHPGVHQGALARP